MSGPPLALPDALPSVTQAETELASLRLDEAQIENFLAVLLVGPVPVGLTVPLTLADQKNGTVIAAGLPSELMVTRPDILAAEEKLRAARANIGAARAALFPSIQLTGSIGFASPAHGNLIRNEGIRWS